MVRLSFRLGKTLVLSVLFAVSALQLSCFAQTPEFRAYWVDAWHPGFKSAAECEQLIADVKASNCNVIVAQMRRRGDTYYPSAIEPFATDADPNFDALRYLLDRCHAESPPIQVHAWLVLLPIWNSDTPPTDPNHPYLKYPQYLTKTDAGTTVKTFDPGHPECEQYLNNVVMELVNNYPDLDGISYDYSRFGAQNEGYNPKSVERFNARYNRSGNPAYTDPLWSQWRRDQITNLIRKTYANAIAVNPNICMSSAVVTWHPSPSEAGDFHGTRPYYQVFQDWEAWMEEGILDLSMPMCYFDKRESYASDYDDWIAFAKQRQYNRGTVIGPGIYMNSVADSIYQLRQTRDPVDGRPAMGAIMYSYASTNDENNDGTPSSTGDVPNSTFYYSLSHPSIYDPNPTPIYNTKVSVPAMPWKTNPTKGHIRGTVYDCDGTTWLDHATVSISGPENRSMYVDGTGFYAFIDLTPGVYTVTASYPNRPAEHAQVQVVAGQMSTADFIVCADPTPPVISNVRSENVGRYSADIRWTTDDPATSQVEYGPTTSYGAMTPISTSYVCDHIVHLDGLVSGQTYHFRVRSKNASNVESVSGDYTFTTIADTTPPVITNVRVASVWFDEACITWETDDPATSQVLYGLTPSYGSATVEDTTLTTNHNVLVTGLVPGTTYHFCVKSTNSVGMVSYSTDYTFTTSPPVEVIVDDLQAVFTETAPDYVWVAGTQPGGWPTDNSQYKYVWNYKSGSKADCTWTPNLPVAGIYDVYVWYRAASNQTTAARFTITHANGTTGTIYVNQQQNGSQWYKIAGGLQFNAGTSGYVRLINRTSETSKTKYVVADAVKFVLVSGVDTTPPTVPQSVSASAVSTTAINVSWAHSTDNVGVVGYKVYRNGQLAGTTYTNSFTDTGLVPNTQYAYTVSAFDAKQNESAQSNAVYRYTLSLPPTDATITCNRSPGIWYNTSRFTFGNGGFGPGGVSYYRYAWDTSPTHTWNGTEFVWAASIVDLNTSSGSDGWYFHVQSYNGDGVPNGALDKGPYYFDGDPPTVTDVTAPKYVAVRGSAYDNLSVNWHGSDSASGIAEYQYAVGSSPGAIDILGWTSAGPNTFAAYRPDNPQFGCNYYWSVKARDEAGNWSTVVTSNPSIYANAYNTLAEAMNNPDTTPVIIEQPKLLNAALGDCYYLQEFDRSRGLRIAETTTWQPGSLVRVAGRLGVFEGERQLEDVEASYMGDQITPRPVGIRISCIGGASPDGYTPGVSGMGGCYNIGILVRTTGRVLENGTGYFVISDGSGATSKVYSEVVPSLNAFVGVTGVAGIESGSRVIRTRGAQDVQIY